MRGKRIGSCLLGHLDLLDQIGGFLEIPMSGQRLLIHVIRVGAADLQLDDQVDEYWLTHTVLIFCLQILLLIVLNCPRERRVDELPPVCICGLPLGLLPSGIQ